MGDLATARANRRVEMYVNNMTILSVKILNGGGQWGSNNYEANNLIRHFLLHAPTALSEHLDSLTLIDGVIQLTDIDPSADQRSTKGFMHSISQYMNKPNNILQSATLGIMKQQLAKVFTGMFWCKVCLTFVVAVCAKVARMEKTQIYSNEPVNWENVVERMYAYQDYQATINTITESSLTEAIDNAFQTLPAHLKLVNIPKGLPGSVNALLPSAGDLSTESTRNMILRALLRSKSVSKKACKAIVKYFLYNQRVDCSDTFHGILERLSNISVHAEWVFDNFHGIKVEMIECYAVTGSAYLTLERPKGDTPLACVAEREWKKEKNDQGLEKSLTMEALEIILHPLHISSNGNIIPHTITLYNRIASERTDSDMNWTGTVDDLTVNTPTSVDDVSTFAGLPGGLGR